MEKNVLTTKDKKKDLQREKLLNGKRPTWARLNINTFYLFDNIHFIFYLTLLGIVYIGNSHFAMKTVKEIKEAQSELERMNWENNSKKSKLTYERMQSELTDKVRPLGLVELEESPHKIIIEK